jgi:hypothetical protein
MFLAYNNGISTTAEDVGMESGEDGQRCIAAMKNLQIVNGGQTTATLYDVYKHENNDLSSISVQVKITVLKDPLTVDQHVPLISKYANTQTKVNVSDFSANEPYHVKLEQLSRSIWVPNPDSRGKSTSKWYYERARGQYINDVNNSGTKREMDAFKIQYPKSQILTKTLIAKYEMSWRQYPHVVSKGSETNFIVFMDTLYDEGQFVPDETYFKRLVAKAILFKSCDVLVKKKEGFGGYWANVVTYSIALLSYALGNRINLDKIWEDQNIGKSVEAALSRASDVVWVHINSPPKEGMNIGSWCKKAECWESLKLKPVGVKISDEECIGSSEDERPGLQELPLHSSVNGTIAEVETNAYIASDWKSLAHWGSKSGALLPFEKKLVYAVGRYMEKGKPISPKQMRNALKIMKEAEKLGYAPLSCAKT